MPHSLRVATYLLGSLSQSKFSELSFLSFPLSTKAWEKPDHMVIQVQEAPDVIRLKYGWVHGRGISLTMAAWEFISLLVFTSTACGNVTDDLPCYLFYLNSSPWVPGDLPLSSLLSIPFSSFFSLFPSSLYLNLLLFSLVLSSISHLFSLLYSFYITVVSLLEVDILEILEL